MITTQIGQPERARLTTGKDLEVFITTRCGDAVIANLKPSEVTFNRIIDDTSTASLKVRLGSTDEYRRCCAAIVPIINYTHELEIWVDKCLLWAGPVSLVDISLTMLKIEAKDLTAWWEVRVLPEIVRGSPRDISVIAEDYHEIAMRVSPIQCFQILTKPVGRFAKTEIFSEENRTAYDAISELAEFGIDFTAVARQVLIGPPTAFTHIPYVLRDRDWKTPPAVRQRGPGEGFATEIIAYSEEGAPIRVRADAATIATYGIIQRVVEFTQLTEANDLRSAALAYLNTFKNPFAVNPDSLSDLKPGIGIDIKSLIAGNTIDVEVGAGCEILKTRMRIQSVEFTWRRGEGLSISLSLEPPPGSFGFADGSEVIG